MDFEEKVKVLRSFPIFKVLPISEVKAIAYATKVSNLEPKTMLIAQGESSEAVYFVVSGSLKIYRVTENGEEINLAVAGPGDVVGEMALIDSEPRSAFAQTLQETRVLSITGSDFIKILRVYPETALSMLSFLSKKLRETDQQMEDVMTKNLIQRTFKTLEILSKYFDRGEIAMSHEELASIIGATRARVTEALDELNLQGKIILDHKKIVLT